MQQAIASLIPPLVTVFLVFVTRNVIWSLIAGAFSASLIVSQINFLGSIKLFVFRIFKVLEIGNLTSVEGFFRCEKLFLFMFLLVLGMVIATIAESGEGYGYVEFLYSRLRTKVQAQFAAIVLSFTLFIDDYLNALMTSSVMRDLTDKFRIPRIKLAFLTTAMAAPLCSLVPISSWAAAIIMFLVEAGIRSNKNLAIVVADPFTTLCRAAPFMFFSLFLIVTAIFVVSAKISYGVIAEHEKIAEELTHNLFGGIHAPVGGVSIDVEKKNLKHSPLSFFAPLIVLCIAIFMGMLGTGGFFTSGVGVVESIKASMAELSLLIGAFTSLVFTMILFLSQSKITVKDACKAIKDGASMMKDSLIVLTLAWTLASFMTSDLHTGKYMAKILMPFISKTFLPLSIFLMSGVISFSIGSSWATMAVMFPIVVPMAVEFAGASTPALVEDVISIYPVIGAVISGAIFGSSLSPIADLLVITSKNTQVNHFDYVKAQTQYLLPVGVGAALSFGIAGILTDCGYWKLFLLSAIPGVTVTFAMMSLLAVLHEPQ